MEYDVIKLELGDLIYKIFEELSDDNTISLGVEIIPEEIDAIKGLEVEFIGHKFSIESEIYITRKMAVIQIFHLTKHPEIYNQWKKEQVPSIQIKVQDKKGSYKYKFSRQKTAACAFSDFQDELPMIRSELTNFISVFERKIRL